MFDKLESLESRYQELERLLSNPKIISDNLLYQKYAREFSQISDLVNAYREYKKINLQIKELEEVLNTKQQDRDFLELAHTEIKTLKERLSQIKKNLETLLFSETADSNKDIIVEIRAGTGGLEAGLFAGDLYRMYTKYALKKSWMADILSSHPTEAGGFKEIIFALKGKEVHRFMKYESGVHRVQRVPETEASGRIHTSTATVAVLVEPQEVELKIDSKDLKIDVYRSSGPGGQSVNTADSAVRITHLPSGMVITCQDERSQLKNKLKAMRVLRARLSDKLRQEEESKVSRERKSQIGSGDRSEKIRTYNFPDRRVTDHRISLTLHRLEEVMDGNLDEIINALISKEASKV